MHIYKVKELEVGDKYRYVHEDICESIHRIIAVDKHICDERDEFTPYEDDLEMFCYKVE